MVVGAHAAGLIALSGLRGTAAPAPERTPALMVEFVTPPAPVPASAPVPTPPPPTAAPPPPPPKPPAAKQAAAIPVPKRAPTTAPAPAPVERAEPSAPAPDPSPPQGDPAPPAPPPVAVAAPSAPAAAEPAPLTPARYDAAYLDNPRPAYPRLARRRGEEGQVILRVHVLGNGRPAVVEVAQSSRHPRLDEAAREAVLGWRFVPARQGDVPVDSWLRVPIVFRLEE